MPGIVGRVQTVVGGQWSNTSAPTANQRRNLEIGAREFEAVIDDLTELVEGSLPALEDRLEEAGVPWTPGRGVPRWPPN